MMGLLVGAPVAMAQQATPPQPSASPAPDQPNTAQPAVAEPLADGDHGADQRHRRAAERGLLAAGAQPQPPRRRRARHPAVDHVINRALMQSQGATSLAEALRNVPGITIGAAEGGRSATTSTCDGFTARTDIYLDGMRDRGQYYRDIFALDQIEVLKGPSSMLFGRGSTGGVINQVSKQPTLKQAHANHRSRARTNGLSRDRRRQPADRARPPRSRVNAMGQDGRSRRAT